MLILDTHTSTRSLQQRINKRWDDLGLVDSITGMRLAPRDPWTCFVEDDGDEGEGGEPPGKTFTQADVDRIVKTRLKKQERELAQATKRAEESEKATAELTKKFDSLQEKFDATNKSDIEKELAKLQREMERAKAERETLAKERDEAKALAEQATSGLAQTQLQSTLRDALRENKAHGKGMEQAVRLMLAEGAAFDEDGNFAFKVGDVPYDKPIEAAKKWLEANPHFAEGTAGGSGTPRIGNSRVMTDEQLDAMPAVSLIEAGLSAPPTGGTGK